MLTTENKLFSYTHSLENIYRHAARYTKLKNPCYRLCSWSHEHNRIIGP